MKSPREPSNDAEGADEVTTSDEVERPPGKFEWRPEDVVVLEPGDPECDDADGDEE